MSWKLTINGIEDEQGVIPIFNEENGELIVRAVNEYEALLKCEEELRDWRELGLVPRGIALARLDALRADTKEDE